MMLKKVLTAERGFYSVNFSYWSFLKLRMSIDNSCLVSILATFENDEIYGLVFTLKKS